MGINMGANAIVEAKLGDTQVNKIYLGGTEVWGSSPAPAIKALRFTSSGAQTLGVDTTKLGTITPIFEFSTDDGASWQSWNVSTALTFGNGVDLYVRGNNTFLAKANTNYTQFVFSTNSPVECSGNIMHLFNYNTDRTIFPDSNTQSRGVKNMFRDCTALVSAPSLPATRMVQAGYQYMFYGCANLATIPALPASVLATSCYGNMFDGCSSIKISETMVGEYQNEFVFGVSPAQSQVSNMFANTGGIFTGTPTQQTYYTSNVITL